MKLNQSSVFVSGLEAEQNSILHFGCKSPDGFLVVTAALEGKYVYTPR